MVQVQRKYFRLAESPDGPLVVILHGMSQSPEAMASVRSAVIEALPGASTYVPRMPYASKLSRRAPELIAADLLDEIDVLMGEYGFSELVLVGHSMSSLIARKVAVLIHGEIAGTPFEPGLERHCQPKYWADRLTRLILLAGISRGWTSNAAQNWLTSAVWGAAALFGDVMFAGGFTILGIRLGAPFVVQTRLQWLALMKDDRARHIVTAQLLGSIDDMVAPDDTVDSAVDLSNKSFVLIDLPATDHRQAVDMRADDGAAAERRRRFKAALSQSPEHLRRTGIAVPALLASNGAPPRVDEKITDVVFVIHGIRDKGFWTQKVARKVMEEAERSNRKLGPGQPKRKVRSMTLSYGYLAMGPFILPWVRRDKVRWLMDRYADCRALYPNAEFSYVGHSNGTYLAARALEDYPAARFRRIVFAGSVVRRDYDWRGRIAGARRQVEEVMNYVASADLVVAIFPNGFSHIRVMDLGGAGHCGFDDLPRSHGKRVSRVPIGPSTSYQIDYVSGGHSAGIKESQWDEIAQFVVNGEAPDDANPDFVAKQARWAIGAGSLPPLFLILLAALLLPFLGLLFYGVAWAAGHLLAYVPLLRGASDILGMILAAFVIFSLLKVVLTRL